jgi:hypothetical protein
MMAKPKELPDITAPKAAFDNLLEKVLNTPPLPKANIHEEQVINSAVPIRPQKRWPVLS